MSARWIVIDAVVRIDRQSLPTEDEAIEDAQVRVRVQVTVDSINRQLERYLNLGGVQFHAATLVFEPGEDR